MAATISREELTDKLDRGDDFILVEPLSEKKYQHAHLLAERRKPAARPSEGNGTRGPAGQERGPSGLLREPKVNSLGEGRPRTGGVEVREREGLRGGQEGLGRRRTANRRQALVSGREVLSSGYHSRRT